MSEGVSKCGNSCSGFERPSHATAHLATRCEFHGPAFRIVVRVRGLFVIIPPPHSVSNGSTTPFSRAVTTPQVLPLHHRRSYSTEWIRSTSRNASMLLAWYEALSWNAIHRHPQRFLNTLTWLAERRREPTNASPSKGIHKIAGTALVDTVRGPGHDRSSQSSPHTSLDLAREGKGWRITSAGGKSKDTRWAESGRIYSRSSLVWLYPSRTFTAGYRST